MTDPRLSRDGNQTHEISRVDGRRGGRRGRRRRRRGRRTSARRRRSEETPRRHASASAASGAATTTATETDGRGRNPRMHISTAPGSARSGDRASARSDGERFVSVGDASDAPNASRTATDRRGREARDDTRASRRGISCARWSDARRRVPRARRVSGRSRRNAAALAIGKRRDAEARNLSKKFSNFQTANAVERRDSRQTIAAIQSATQQLARGSTRRAKSTIPRARSPSNSPPARPAVSARGRRSKVLAMFAHTAARRGRAAVSRAREVAVDRGAANPRGMLATDRPTLRAYASGGRGARKEVKLRRTYTARGPRPGPRRRRRRRCAAASAPASAAPAPASPASASRASRLDVSDRARGGDARGALVRARPGGLRRGRGPRDVLLTREERAAAPLPGDLANASADRPAGDASASPPRSTSSSADAKKPLPASGRAAARVLLGKKDRKDSAPAKEAPTANGDDAEVFRSAADAIRRRRRRGEGPRRAPRGWPQLARRATEPDSADVSGPAGARARGQNSRRAATASSVRVDVVDGAVAQRARHEGVRGRSGGERRPDTNRQPFFPSRSSSRCYTQLPRLLPCRDRSFHAARRTARGVAPVAQFMARLRTAGRVARNGSFARLAENAGRHFYAHLPPLAPFFPPRPNATRRRPPRHAGSTTFTT